MVEPTYQPTLSVIVPAFNEEGFIEHCISSLQRAGNRLREEKKQYIEIIVVDNNSTDRTGEIARQAGARVIFEPYNNISRARNIGANQAQGEFLAFVDADMCVSEDLLCSIDENLMDSRSVGGGTRVRPEKWTFNIFVYWIFESSLRFLFGGFSGVLHCRKKEFEDMRGFDEQCFIAEKINFYRRLRLYGRWRSQEIKDAGYGIVTVSMRVLAHNSPWTIIKNFLPFLWKPNLKVRNPEYCKMWYAPPRSTASWQKSDSSPQSSK